MEVPLEPDIARSQNSNTMSIVTVPVPYLTLVEDDIRDSRYALCKACEFFTVHKTCSKCNCIMPVKVVWADSECPIGKWLKLSDIATIPVDSIPIPTDS